MLATGTESAGGTSSLLTVGDGTEVKGAVAAPSSTTSPFAPRITYGSSATVKNAGSAVTPNVDTAQVSRSPYVPDFTINPVIQQTVLPTTLPTTLNLGTPGAPTPSVYYDTSPSIATTVNINGPVIWYIAGSLRVNTGDTININSTGSLLLYITTGLSSGRFRVESGSGGIINRTQDPKKLAVFGDYATSTTQYYNHTAAPFYGVIYLPETTATAGLSLANGVEVFGALSASKLTFVGPAKIHYDTSLRYATFPGVEQPYTVTDWRELPAGEEATMP